MGLPVNDSHGFPLVVARTVQGISCMPNFSFLLFVFVLFLGMTAGDFFASAFPHLRKGRFLILDCSSNFLIDTGNTRTVAGGLATRYIFGNDNVS